MLRQLRRQGAYLVEIAHQIGCSERTVKRMLALPAPPTRRPRMSGASKLDDYKAYIDQQLASGVWNAAVLLQQLKEQGYTGLSANVLHEYARIGLLEHLDNLVFDKSGLLHGNLLSLECQKVLLLRRTPDWGAYDIITGTKRLEDVIVKAPSIEEKRAYFARTRRANYVASLRLEGFDVKPSDAHDKPFPRAVLLKQYGSKKARS